ncbi:MAG: aminopeptidase [Bacteroidia bacterium]|nr:aminopeptidase [Bacteroidia bacterium]MCZ2247671.1 aminopeptidase [Bacteroidia bacterium]
MKHNLLSFIISFGILFSSNVKSQNITNKKNGGFIFTPEKEISYSPVKNQYKSGTCWSFSTQSFLESELARMGKPMVDLSDMFVVRNTYSQKGEKYVRMQGTINFGAGSEFHDAINVLRTNGVVPESAYPIKNGGKPELTESDKVLKAMLDEIIKRPNGDKLSPNWKDAFEAVLDAYYGKTPDSFEYNGKKYTPKSFAAELGLNADDYVAIGSYTHHPFYEQFIIEVSDNWSWGKIYNVPLDEMQKITDNAINNNFTVAWASDVSEFGFSFKNGVAIVPVKDKADMTQAEKDSAFSKPMEELNITQELRQAAFDNLSTTDDHGMHIIGSAKDQNGKRYYTVKNSWGTENNDLGGIFYVSTAYFKYKTTSILVHKKALPADIAKKLNIKQ